VHALTGHGAQDSTDRLLSPSSAWTADHLARLATSPSTTIPPIDPQLPRPLFPGLDLWDMWPLQDRDGSIAGIDGGQIWFILSSPRLPDPDHRHAIARIRLVERRGEQWIDHGNCFPDDFTPGSREWAGSAVRNPADDTITHYFTAAGTRGDARDNWQQRIFASTGHWRSAQAKIAIDWDIPQEILVADGAQYQKVTADIGRAGFIKGFRDPAWFADPLDGAEYLLFTASLANVESAFDGAIGLARRNAAGAWALLAPAVAMTGVNNEPERPHIVYHAGRYYLFFSTQTRMFAPGIFAGPNGLYAMVADSMAGPWQPVNGTGLVAANPDSAPQQAYSWWVTSELQVYGFADLLGPTAARPVDDPKWRRDHFAGVPAPVFQLSLAGATSSISDSCS
jgi:levansucrase